MGRLHLLWIGVLLIVEVFWSLSVSRWSDISRMTKESTAATASAVLLSIPLIISGIVAISFGVRRNASDYTARVDSMREPLLPWYLLIAGFPGFILHVALYVFYAAFYAAKNFWLGYGVFLICWEIFGAVVLVILSIIRKERVSIILRSLALYAVGVIGSFGIGFAAILR